MSPGLTRRLTFGAPPNDALAILRPFLALPLMLVSLACAHPAYGPPDEDRLAAAVTGDTAEAKGQLQACDDEQEALGKARNAERSESERLRSYMEVVKVLAERVEQNQAVAAKDPDITYAGGANAQASSDSRQILETCRQMHGDARREFDDLVHDLFQPLLVLDISGGHHTRSARVSLPLLRSAVDVLAPSDADALKEKLSEAEKVLQAQKKGG